MEISKEEARDLAKRLVDGAWSMLDIEDEISTIRALERLQRAAELIQFYLRK